MKLNAILVFVIVTVALVIVLSSLFKERTVYQPKAAPVSSATIKESVLLDPSRSPVLSAPSLPVVANLTSSFSGQEVAFVTELGDLYIYSSDFVYLANLPHVIDASVSAQIQPILTTTVSATVSALLVSSGKQTTEYVVQDDPLQIIRVGEVPTLAKQNITETNARFIYAKLHETDNLQTALMVKHRAKQITGKTVTLNELVGITGVDQNNPQDQLRITNELLQE